MFETHTINGLHKAIRLCVGHAKLRPRHAVVLKMLLEGYFCKEIADKLGVSLSTIRTDVASIYRKFNVSSRVALISKLGRFTLDVRWVPNPNFQNKEQ